MSSVEDMVLSRLGSTGKVEARRANNSRLRRSTLSVEHVINSILVRPSAIQKRLSRIRHFIDTSHRPICLEDPLGTLPKLAVVVAKPSEPANFQGKGEESGQSRSDRVAVLHTERSTTTWPASGCRAKEGVPAIVANLPRVQAENRYVAIRSAYPIASSAGDSI